MSTSVHSEYPFVNWLVAMTADWVARRRRVRAAADELSALPPQEFSRIARDIGISSSQLDELASQPREFPQRLKLMLRALRINQAKAQSIDPILMRDAQLACSLCTSKRRCKRELLAGSAAGTFTEFCPNAGSLQLLSEECDRRDLAVAA